MTFKRRIEICNTLHNPVFPFITLLASYVTDTQIRNSNSVSSLTLSFKQQFKRDIHIENTPLGSLYYEKLF